MTKGNVKFEVRNSDIDSRGLFATQKISKGETVTHWRPKVLTKGQVSKLPAEEREHYLIREGDKFLWMQPPERYVNHSCNANTHVVGRS